MNASRRCRHAWLVEAGGGGRPLPEAARALLGRTNGEGFIGFWEAMARAELRRDPALLRRGAYPGAPERGTTRPDS